MTDFLSVAREFATKRQWRLIYGRSRSEATAAFCRQCMGGNMKDIEECTDQSCPLRPFRPGRPPGEGRPEWLKRWLE